MAKARLQKVQASAGEALTSILAVWTKLGQTRENTSTPPGKIPMPQSREANIEQVNDLRIVEEKLGTPEGTYVLLNAPLRHQYQCLLNITLKTWACQLSRRWPLECDLRIWRVAVVVARLNSRGESTIFGLGPKRLISHIELYDIDLLRQHLRAVKVANRSADNQVHEQCNTQMVEEGANQKARLDLDSGRPHPHFHCRLMRSSLTQVIAKKILYALWKLIGNAFVRGIEAAVENQTMVVFHHVGTDHQTINNKMKTAMPGLQRRTNNNLSQFMNSAAFQANRVCPNPNTNYFSVKSP